MFSPDVQAYFDEDTFTVTYVVFDSSTGDAIVIDPVLDYDVFAAQTSTGSVDKVIAFLGERKLTLRAVLETHAHADHISAGQLLKSRYSVPFGIGAGIESVQKTFAKVFDFSVEVPVDGSQFDILFEPGSEYAFGSLKIRVLGTPGHTPACVSYYIGDAIFTGDALFMEDYGTGRADFPGGSAEALHSSVTKTLYALPGATRVFVGHDYQPDGREVRFESTIDRERESNIQIKKETTEAEFIKFRNSRDETLRAPRLIYPSIQINVFGGNMPSAADNGVRYLKIPFNTRDKTDGAGISMAKGAKS